MQAAFISTWNGIVGRLSISFEQKCFVVVE
jgi:hypothetical protein